jgi:UDP-glucose 4-epimerase
LVTGGAGFIGSNIARTLLRSGHKVVIVDDLSAGREHNVPKGATFYHLDVRDNGLEKVFKDHAIEFVAHQAARGDVRGSLLRPGEYVDVNIRGGVNVLECCRKNGVRGIAFASSGGCVYGEPNYVPTDENHPMQPRDPYGATKACFEIYLQTYFQLYGLGYTIFRYPNVYGPYQDPYGEAGVISIFTKAMLDGKPITINGDGRQTRDFVFVDDVVRANLMAIERNANATYNVGTGIGTDINTIFETLRSILKYPDSARHDSPKTGEVSRSVLNSHRIQSDWGWQPLTDLRDGLEQTVAYIREHEHK